MIILSTTSDKVQVVLDATVTTNQLKCFASYTDTTTTSITPGRNALTTNNTTAVDMVSGPSSSTQRLVSYISVYNTDTASATVTINLYTTSTTYKLFTTTLAVGEKLEYQQGEGFKVFTSDGSYKETPNAIGAPVTNTISHVMLSSDQSMNSTSFADVTGLSIPVLANKQYWFKFVIVAASAATSVGVAWSINGPTFTDLKYYSYFANTNSVATTQYNNAVSSYDSITATPGGLPTRGLAFIEGLIQPSVNGTLIARFRSENLNTVTAKAGSVLFYQQLT